MIKKNFNGKSNAGFTLIELLAVMIVLVSTGSIVVAILFNTLKGANKTNALQRVSRSGNFAVENLSRDLKFAYGFFGISKDGASFDKDICSSPLSPAPTPAPTPDFSDYKYIKIYDQNREEVTYYCDKVNNVFKKNDSPLFDNSTIDVTSCSFSCSQEFPTDPPSIGIKFTLKDKMSDVQADFQTSVTMRNLNK